MKKRHLFKSLAAVLFTAMLTGGAWGANPVPLSQVPIPMPPNLGDFVKDKAAAIKLGKALFWDMNVGGDGVQACASCHYRAGADPFDVRATNQLHPGANGLFDVLAGPNQTLTSAMFPFFQVADPNTARLDDGLAITRNLDDVVGSQGVSFNLFNAIVFGSALDNGTPVNDPTFGHSRRVTGRNTPSAVNAVFNFANFHDGRANNIFNGSSPIGPLDPTAGIWVNLNAHLDEPILQFQKVAIPNASLASQAVGPPNNDTEMSWAGRNFPQLGRKLLNNGLTPLGQQLVSPNDSVLGGLSNSPANGINATYSQMIQNAFWEKYWDSFAPNINIGGASYSQIEANFSLFWGLSVMLYEATLVSDLTPFDCWLNEHDDAGNVISPLSSTLQTACAANNIPAMSPAAVEGFKFFTSGAGKCSECHAGSEMSDATVSFALANGLIQQGETNAGNAISDIGFHNIGVRPTADNIGRGGIGGSPNPIASFAGQAIAQANGTLPFPAPQAIFGGITPNTPVAVNGAFKTPQLRNLELTAPFMHNGSMLTLEQVVEFYTRGGNFANPEQAVDMSPIGQLRGAPDKRAEVVAFLQALTDPRVAAESAPFDHPELRIPDGTSATLNDDGTDPKITRPVTGNNDFDPIANLLAKPLETTTLADLPVAEISGAPPALTNEKNATMTVGGADVVTYQYTVDGGLSSADIPVATPITLANLADGVHTVSVHGKDAAGHAQLGQTSVSWTVDSAPPFVTVGAPETMTKKITQTISGTMSAGATVNVSVDTGATVGPVTAGGSTWSCQVSGLSKGTNNITVTATDAAGNAASATAIVSILFADGSFSGTGSPAISDALKALRMAVGIIQPTTDDLLHGDVAPTAAPDGKIDTSDALLILRKVVGLTSF